MMSKMNNTTIKTKEAPIRFHLIPFLYKFLPFDLSYPTKDVPTIISRINNTTINTKVELSPLE